MKRRNPVAKNMNKANRAAAHRDKKNDYRRTPKHKKNPAADSLPK